MAISLEWYRVFYQIARQGSVSRAAEALFITQSAVSQCLRLLEQELGVVLFVRTPRGMRLTPEGEELYRFVARGVESIAQGEKHLRQVRGLESGSIRLGASDMTLEFFLLEHLETFHKRYPGVRISVTNVSTPETLRLLHDGAIDFGAVSSPVDGQAGLVVRSVSEIQDVFVAGARFDELRGRTLSPLQLAGLPIVCLEQNTSTRRYIDAFLSEHGVRLQPEFELATSPLIAQFAARGMGVGSLVRNFALPFLRDGRLFELTLSPSPPPRNICLVYDGRLPLSTAASRLLEQML